MSADEHRQWYRVCIAVSVVWLLVVIPVRFIRDPARIDFPQYYMGGLIAREGRWSDLYPIPQPGCDRNPGAVADSTMRPGYASLANESGVGEGTRFIQPPPVSLLFVPLSCFPYPTACYIWLFVLCVVSLMLGIRLRQITVLIWPGSSTLASATMLLFSVSPLAYWSIRVGNVSPIVALCLAELSVATIRRNQARAAAMVAMGGLLKYATVSLLPLLILRRQWWTLVWSVVGGLGMVAVTLAFTGSGPFRQFACEIVPTLGRSSEAAGNLSLQGTLLRSQSVHWIVSAVRHCGWSILCLIVWLLSKTVRGPRTATLQVLGGAIVLTAWLLLFSPISWDHYVLYVVPFWGVILGSYRVRSWLGVLGAMAIVLQVLPAYAFCCETGKVPAAVMAAGTCGTAIVGGVGAFLCVLGTTSSSKAATNSGVRDIQRLGSPPRDHAIHR